MNNKKKVILSSVLSIALCLSLIAGSTFALFTSTSPVNVAVTSGKVSVKAFVEDLKLYSFEIEQEDNTFANGGTAEYKEGTLTLDKVTPGDKATFTIVATNDSTVKIQYRIKMVTEGTLSDALVATAKIGDAVYTLTNEESSTGWIPLDALADIPDVAMSVELPADKGNEWQDKSANVTVLLEAVQANGTDMYGSNVENIGGDEDLQTVLKNAKAGEPLYILLDKDVTYVTESSHGLADITPASSVVIDGQGLYTLTATGAGVKPMADDEAPLTLKNLTVIDKSVSYAENAWEFTYLELGGSNLTCENVTFKDEIQLTGANATFLDCTFESNEESVYAVWVEEGSAIFTNCTFVGFRGLKAHEYYGSEITSILVDKCTFDSLVKKPGIAIGTLNSDTDVTVQNSTFINCQAGDQGLYIYETDTPVRNFNFKEENNDIINGEVLTEGLYHEVAKKTFYVTNANGLMSLGEALKAVSPSEANIQTVNLMSSISLLGLEWDPITSMWVTFNGNGHTISNLIAGFDETGRRSGFWGYAGAVTINDLTLENVTANGSQAGTFAGAAEGLKINNCFLSGMNAVTFASGVETWNGIGAIVGTCTSSTLNVTILESTTVVLDKNGFTTDAGCTYIDDLTGYISANQGAVVNNGLVTNLVSSVADINEKIKNGDSVVLNTNMTISSKDTTLNSGYGAAGIVLKNGNVFDGNGNTLTVNDANGTWDCAVNLENGTLKNVTVNGAFRGIFMGGAAGDVIIDNVVVDKVCYTFNSDAGSKDYSVIIKNSTLNGWTSYSDVHKLVTFENCNFGQGTGGYQYAFCRPYNASVFENCVFDEGFEFDTSKTSDITFINCYYGDTLITAENAASLGNGETTFFYNGLNGITIK